MNGILVVNKPIGLSSHQVIQTIKRTLKIKKIGHAGTLDPLASGVLIVLLNDATKLSDYLMADNKTYLAGIVLGTSTDTEDSLGKVQEEKKVTSLSQVDQVLSSMIGPLKQIPPMYSAIKQDGKKLYELAREGKEVSRKSRDIEILTLERKTEITYQDDQAYFQFETRVSKGTYIRTLCVDIGEKLGYPAHMNSLVRLSSGKFSIADSYTLEEIKEGRFKIISNLEAINHYPVVDLNEELYFKVKNGQKISQDEVMKSADLIVFKYENNLIAIYKKEENIYKAERVWN